MKDTYYFSHDYNPTNDPKITCLIGNYGGLGYGVYWRIVEMLHQEDNNKLPKKIFIYEAIAKQMLTSAEQIEELIKDCIDKYELFQSDDDFFWSKRVVRNIEERNEKYLAKVEAGRIGGIKSGITRANRSNTKATLKQNEATLKQNEATLKQNEAKRTKEKKRKENKSLIIDADAPNNKFELLKSMGLPPEPKRKVEMWQDEASNVVKYFIDGSSNISSIFKCFKDNNKIARQSFTDCKELNKNSVMYFFKVYNELNKRQI